MNMYKLIYIIILIIPILATSQSKALHTRILINAWSEYDTWVHLDPFYLDEPAQDVDNFRPVDYE